MYAVLRPRNGVMRWHSYGFHEPEEVVDAMLNGYLEGLENVRKINWEHFRGWQHADGWQAAGWRDTSQEIARQYVRTAMWQDRELARGCITFIDRHYDGGSGNDGCKRQKLPYLIHPAE